MDTEPSAGDGLSGFVLVAKHIRDMTGKLVPPATFYPARIAVL